MRLSATIAISVLLLSLVALPLLAACGGDGDKEEPTATETATAKPTVTVTPTKPAGPVKVKIGNLTDLTGIAAVPMQAVNAGFEDIVRYYNENNLIPGVEVEVVNYDTQSDPSKDKPGWEFLKERGCVVMEGWLPAQAPGLQPLAEQDKIPLFLSNAPIELLATPGYMFLTGVIPEERAWNYIKWVMENDWDYKTRGPAKVGAAAWVSDNPDEEWDQYKKYAEMYPERMTWVGGYAVPPSTFQWTGEVEALKNCDYIHPPNMFSAFVKAYVSAGYDKAKFMCTDSMVAWFAVLDDMKLWPDIDGTLFITQSEWWGEDAEYPKLANDLVRKYRPGSLDEFTRSGKGYFSVINGMIVLEAIKNAAAKVGPENIDAQAVYEGAQSVKLSFDGIQRFSFTETKRDAVDRLAIYKADGSAKGLVRASDWLAIEPAP